MLGDVVNRRRLVTITLRTSTQQKQRNSDLDSWFTVYSRLRDEGFDVLVVPDFEDLASLRSYAKYPWALFLPAALDLEIRLALYSRSIQNLGVLNGVLVPLFHSNLPYLIFKPNVESVPVTSRKWLKDVFGIEHGDNFWWAGASQELAWDSDHDSNKILERFFRVIGATS
jgi:hypothetical protein